MKAYVKGYKKKHIVLESENLFEKNLLKSWSNKQPVVSGGTGNETIGGKPTHRRTLRISFYERQPK